MQLKPLTKGRFHSIWQQDDAFIERTFRELLSDKQLIAENEHLYHQGQVVDRLIMVESGRISLRYSAETAVASSWVQWNAMSNSLVKWSFSQAIAVSWIS
ncbi:hypothetical protein [Klebsiella oxytoca]|uniref:hypothetical protein n=1 Tax=Klebsiella oxytoca TaxID=571 RepID=UPI00387A7E4C